MTRLLCACDAGMSPPAAAQRSNGQAGERGFAGPRVRRRSAEAGRGRRPHGRPAESGAVRSPRLTCRSTRAAPSGSRRCGREAAGSGSAGPGPLPELAGQEQSVTLHDGAVHHALRTARETVMVLASQMLLGARERHRVAATVRACPPPCPDVAWHHHGSSLVWANAARRFSISS